MVRSLADALRDFDDERLAELFDARTDLTREAPASIAALAGRAAQATSVARALTSLRRPELQLAEALAAHNRPLTPEELAHAVSSATETIAPHVYRLATLALLYIDATGHFLLPVRTLGEAIPHPAGLAPVLSTDPDRNRAREIVSHIPDPLQDLAAQLAWSPARIQGSPQSTPARALREAGLATTVNTPDGQRLLIPRSVHLELRNGVVHREFARLPVPTDPAPAEVYDGARDAQGMSAALEADRIAMSLAHWHADPPQVLKRGGVPARDMKRVAAAAGTELTTFSTVVHAAWVASLVGHNGETWQVTKDFSQAAQAPISQRWADLTLAWARGNYVGSIAGTRLSDATPSTSSTPSTPATASPQDPIRAGLSPAVGRPGVKTRRRHLLRVLTDFHEQHCTVAFLARSLAWAFPTVPAPVLREEAAAFLVEAEVFGLLADHAPTSLGFALARTDDLPVSEAITQMAHALEDLLPSPVDHLIIDSDLSVMVPGMPSAALSHLLDWAQILSRGAGITARFTEESVGRAIDSGADPAQVLSTLEAHSLTGVPQPLEYLVRDVARSRAQVHVGAARTVITGEAEHLDRLLDAPESAPLRLVRLAPTVLTSQADPGFVMGQVRKAGLAPLAMGADGVVMSERAVSGLYGGPPSLELESDAANAELELSATEAVARIRQGEAGTLAQVSVTQRLLAAIATGSSVRMGIVDGRGGMRVLTAVPLSLDGGRLRAREVPPAAGGNSVPTASGRTGAELDGHGAEPRNGGAESTEFTVVIHRVTLP